MVKEMSCNLALVAILFNRANRLYNVGRGCFEEHFYKCFEFGQDVV